MIKKIYNVRDYKAGFGTVLMVSDNDDIAKRDFAAACSTQNSMLNQFPEDFGLYLVGEYDTETGLIISYNPSAVANATDFVRKEI